ncbi:hypothetical protein CC1G_03798 [Coprinopsis cinerea okayama7|uniref:NADH dehydrogenase [ubiquinone] 1 beta subcomplex subunit 4 n=1 Tax=Coprinopsis cinerea (strain Okayama-7 / 130 / ATCC MYA-4618 / FGSC 9003) TaxID=240176 RepID=A8NGR6_COPC7|nr:hypothetical protein CC1G_03798 [Coprinopsis cinerea okayama7\|eukprot:XP_001833581.1 hypothetical protein CC1G_03798 [Coprinopsis cinerea okayama7\
MAAENFRHDPAIDRFNSMRENAYLNFRWTRKTVTTAVIGFIVVPVAIYYGTVASTNRWNWNGKRKGEPLAIKP